MAAKKRGDRARLVQIGRHDRRCDRKPAPGSEPPRRLRPPPEIDQQQAVSRLPRRSCGVSVRRTSSTGAKAETTSETGATTARAAARPASGSALTANPCPPESRSTVPGTGRSRLPRCRRAARPRRAAGRGHPVGRQPHVGDDRRIDAAAILVSASPTARRPEAGASSSATGERSPIAMASPANVSKPSAVTPTSLTGTCHGPTSWSRATRPPTVRSPIWMRKDLSATAGRRSTRRHASASARCRPDPVAVRCWRDRAIRAAPSAVACRAASRAACPPASRRVPVGDDQPAAVVQGCRAPHRDSARARTRPQTRPDRPGRWPAHSAPGPRCTRSPAATCPARRSECRAARCVAPRWL